MHRSKEELIYISRQYANMFGLPIRLYQGEEKICMYTTTKLTADPVVLCMDTLYQQTNDTGYWVQDDFYYYGFVKQEEFRFVIGPVTELKLCEHELRRLGKTLHISGEALSHFVLEMQTLSGMHLSTFIQILILLQHHVNGVMQELHEIRIRDMEQTEITSEIQNHEIVNEIDVLSDKEYYANYTRSYLLVNEIAEKVMEGDVDSLIEIQKKVSSLSGGRLALHQLRQQKNFFIKLVTIVARAAVMGGLAVDETLSSEEIYISKCESLSDIDRVKNLEYHMILDFANKVKKCETIIRKIPD